MDLENLRDLAIDELNFSYDEEEEEEDERLIRAPKHFFI